VKRLTHYGILSLIVLLAVGCDAGPPAQQARAGYLDTNPVFWRTLYPDGGESLYCGDRFAARDRDYNIEHVYPMSWVTRALRCGDRDACRRTSERFNLIESDMHNLYPARRDLNKARGSFPFGEIPGERHHVRGCDFEVDFQDRVVEPRPAARGNIARAMLYMEERYGLEIFARQREMLLRWHEEDPVDDDERRRNGLIRELQGEHNPWID
jgi:deoxyribonuclease I